MRLVRDDAVSTPLIKGLAFDEALLGGFIVGVPVVLVTWYVTRRRGLSARTAP